jgi:putative CocE/NonD family hydrolase
MTLPKSYEVEIRHDVRIRMRDGIQLSANLFMPIAKSSDEKFPVILEMIPYRKDDYRYESDRRRMSTFAERGFVGCRVDVRGTGSSEGRAEDEYTKVETQDGYEVVEWLAAQAWCNGNVGMWGISYGGFSAIQVAMLQPPHLKAILPMYATDDRYTGDVHYIGGCMVVSEVAQYAVSQVGMNALPPKPEYAGGDWAERWKERLENTPPWTLKWMREQVDGPYWRNGSLAPDYDRIRCAMYLIGGWNDIYVDPVLRMMEKCAAPRKALIGNWVHALPDRAYPGPNLNWLHEMVRFFDYWLKGIDNGVMDEPALTFFRREYTEPQAFPTHLNGDWQSESLYPPQRTTHQELYLSDRSLIPILPHVDTSDTYPHRPTLGTRASLCWGGGAAPNGLSRDLRPDEALSLTYTGEPLDEALDILGFPEAILHLSCSAPVAHVIVRLSDVAPDGASSQVSAGVLNLTHRESHSEPQALTPREVYQARVKLRATGYRYRPGHRIRLSIASAYWPVIWPSPYASINTLHRGPATPSRLILPVLPHTADLPAVPAFKAMTREAEPLNGVDDGEWSIVEDVIRQTVTVKVYGAETCALPGGGSLFNSERLEMTASQIDPAAARMHNEVIYELKTGHDIRVRATGGVRSTVGDFHVDVQLRVELNGDLFFQRSWLERMPRRLL